MPKVTRTRTRLHKEAAPKVHDRKFSVKEKEVLERIDVNHDEPKVIRLATVRIHRPSTFGLCFYYSDHKDRGRNRRRGGSSEQETEEKAAT